MSAVLAPSIQLRPMQEADLPSVMEIEKAAYNFPWTQSIFKDCLRVGYSAIVLEIYDSIVGYGIISVAVGEAHILNLCIHPELQRCGYGRRILKRLLAIAQQKGAQSVFLEVRPSNQAAILLYHKMGFNQIGVRKKYYLYGDKGREDGLIFALELYDSENAFRSS